MLPGVLEIGVYTMVLTSWLQVVGICTSVTLSVRDRSLHLGVTQSFGGSRDTYKCYLDC